MFLPGLKAVFPKQVHTLAAQYHCMRIIKQSASFLNLDQTPIDTCDQPRYALTREVQWTISSRN